MKYFIVAWPDSRTRVWVFLYVFIQCQYTRTILRNKNMGQSLFKKHSKFQNFDEMFYCSMTRLRNTSLDVFIQCQHTRTILRNKNMGQSLFKKYSKFQKFECWMTRFKNIKLGSGANIESQKIRKPRVLKSNLVY